MSRKWIGGLVAVAAIGAGAFAASSVLGADSSGPVRPAYATVSVDLSHGGAQAPATARRAASAKRPQHKPKKKKPKVVYLQSPSPVTINPAQPSAGGIGPNIDINLTGCSKVMEGGVVPSRADVFVQGSFIKSSNEYHVLIGLKDQANGVPTDPTPFTITSHLTCLKGVK
jgi:hypothetical protein